MTPTITKLTGQELIDIVKSANDNNISKSEMCLAAGYMRVGASGNTVPAFTDFYEALLEAKGIEYDGGPSDADWYDNMTEQAQTLYDQIVIHQQQLSFHRLHNTNPLPEQANYHIFLLNSPCI